MRTLNAFHIKYFIFDIPSQTITKQKSHETNLTKKKHNIIYQQLRSFDDTGFIKHVG